jgi:RNA polymerase sigma-70 factor (sigma-E family)
MDVIGSESRDDAFNAFVVTAGPAVLRFAYLLVWDGSLAEDLVQSALVKLHRHWGRPDIRDTDAYVRRIVLNEFLSWRRRRSNREQPSPAAEASSDDFTDQVVERDLVWQAMGRLPRRQRAVLVLRWYEGRPDVEIAALLGCALPTVRSLSARGLDALRHDPELASSRRSTALPPTTPAKEAGI